MAALADVHPHTMRRVLAGADCSKNRSLQRAKEYLTRAGKLGLIEVKTSDDLIKDLEARKACEQS